MGFYNGVVFGRKQNTVNNFCSKFLASLIKFNIIPVGLPNCGTESGLKARMELIKFHAIQVMQDLKAKAEAAYSDMDDWLGARFQSEMKSIDEVCVIFGAAIEKAEQSTSRVILIQDQFIINKEVKVFNTPSPPPRPSPVETSLSDIFTVEQIQTLMEQFRASAPSGFISTKGFIDTLSDLTALTHGTETLPDQWLSMTTNQLEQLAGTLAPDSEYIDWRAFLLQATHSWPKPTQAELLQTLERFKGVDSEKTGKVTRDQYSRVSLWYDPEERPPTPDDPSEPLPFDRITSNQEKFFDIFADFDAVPPTLDYTQMLMYFSIDVDPVNGFFRALSVASHTHMPRPQEEELLEQTEDEKLEKRIADPVSEEDEESPNVINTTLGPPEEGIPASATKALVPIDALVKVFHHGQPSLGDSHRFSVTTDPEDTFSFERISGVYKELGSQALQPVPFFTLFGHPIILDCLSLSNRFKAPDFRSVFTIQVPQLVETDAQSTMS
ncbi:putative sperm flagellar protein 2-like [Apostichopus japonicus]|uniref:Putative sperm flagellar protein 2-like n=1 Tax=Stichopus japonicus TaxID=307972 RepID=A0A2G8L0A4_STIJA|nr:putative sperm flagellar protein 2-like [Apostichopus japonicus]